VNPVINAYPPTGVILRGSIYRVVNII
jgi:hypothetical protein